MQKVKKGHLGEKIKRIRQFKGVTQQQLAELIRKTRPLVSFFERTGQINKYTLTEIANALHITIEEIEEMEFEKMENNSEEKKIKKSIFPINENLIQTLQNENKFLKETVVQQNLIILEMSKRIKNNIKNP